MKPIPLGVDIETTGSGSSALTIQLGFATLGGDVYERDVNWPLKQLTQCDLSPEALGINGFTIDRILGYHRMRPMGFKDSIEIVHNNNFDVMMEAESWLFNQFPVPSEFAEQFDGVPQGKVKAEQQYYNRLFIPIGWNVASFDMFHIKKDFPKLSKMFHYRSIDLNAVCFTVADALGMEYDEVKGDAKDYAEQRMGHHYKVQEENGTWHQAGFDALAGVYAWEFLKIKINQLPDE